MGSILQILDRPTKKKEQEKQSEVRDRKKGPWIVRNIKWVMFLFFNAVALVFDGLAVTTVYQLTSGSLLFSALSLLPTGIPMFMWEGGWLYSLAEEKQKHLALSGVVISVISALVVGTLAIFATLGDDTLRFWVSTSLLIWCVVVVIVHGVMAAFYFYKDPVIKRDHELQVAISDNEYQETTMREAEGLLKSAERILEMEEAIRKRFGPENYNRALELLLNIDLNNDGIIGDRPAKQPKGQPQQSYAAEVSIVDRTDGKQPDPTQASPSRQR